jgi:hypothetical protein
MLHSTNTRSFACNKHTAAQRLALTEAQLCEREAADVVHIVDAPQQALVVARSAQLQHSAAYAADKHTAAVAATLTTVAATPSFSTVPPEQQVRQ